MIFRAIGLMLCCTPIFAQQAKPTLSTEPISAERLGIYRDFLTNYSTVAKSTFNVARSTRRFGFGYYELTCLKVFVSSDVSPQSSHSFSSNSFAAPARIVDAKTYKMPDPMKLVRRGIPIEEATRVVGILTLSEIIFDASRTHAAFNYSLECGVLCGSGETVLYDLQDGKWRRNNDVHCGGWIS